MAVLTLLDVVNTCLDYMDNYRVSSIDDIHESQQIASIAEKVFNDDVNDIFQDDYTQDIIQLEALADSTKPNYLKLPSGVKHVLDSKIMYNVTTGATGTTTLKMKEIPYLRPQEFLDTVGQRSTNQTNTQIVTEFSGYQMVIQNKTAPQFYTTFDNEYLVFDSFDSDVDSTLQQSKSGAVVTKQRNWTPSDTYEIDLPEWYHQIYLNNVITEASVALREEPIPHIARKARLGKIKARQKKRVGFKGLNTKRRNYGR